MASYDEDKAIWFQSQWGFGFGWQHYNEPTFLHCFYLRPLLLVRAFSAFAGEATICTCLCKDTLRLALDIHFVKDSSAFCSVWLPRLSSIVVHWPVRMWLSISSSLPKQCLKRSTNSNCLNHLRWLVGVPIIPPLSFHHRWLILQQSSPIVEFKARWHCFETGHFRLKYCTITQSWR